MRSLLLLNPPTFWNRFWSRHPSCVHLQCLLAYVRMYNPQIRSSSIDLQARLGDASTSAQLTGARKEIRRILESCELDIVGISCWASIHYLATLEIATICKQINPNCVVVVGGYHPSAVPDDFVFTASPVDYIVRGEGEVALSTLLNSEPHPRTTPEVIDGSPLDLRNDGLPHLEMVQLNRERKSCSVILSRGCPHKCAFCVESCKRPNTNLPTWRACNPQTALRIIDSVVAHGVNMIHILDAIFAFSRTWRKVFLAGLAEREYDVRFWAETNHMSLDDEDIHILSRLSFRLDLGLDGGTPRLLRLMNKTRFPKKYLARFAEVDDLMNRLRLPHKAFLIWNYPGETPEDLEGTRRFLENLISGRSENYTHVEGNTFFLVPGTRVYQELEDYRLAHGSEHLFTQWWKHQEREQYALAVAAIPSDTMLKNGQLLRYRSERSRLARLSLKKMPSAVKRAIKHTRPKRMPCRNIIENIHLKISENATYRSASDGSVIVTLFAEDGVLTATYEQGADIVLAQHSKPATAQQTIEALGAHNRCQILHFLWDLFQKRIIVPAEETPQVLAEPKQNLGEPRVLVRTNLVDAIILLHPDRAPIAVNNFLSLVRKRFYDGRVFYSAGKLSAIETGCPYDDGSGDVGYLLPRETSTGLSHEPGIVSMIGDDFGRFSSRFMICTGYRPDWDGSHTIFGRLLERDALDQIVVEDYIRSIRPFDLLLKN